jgi:hypothetical protein
MAQTSMRKTPGSRVKRLCFCVAMVIVPFAVVLAGIEIALRFVNRSGVADVPAFTINSTYVPLRIRGDYRGVVGGVQITTNRFGFRDEPDFDPIPPPGEYRILSMGDSIAFGLGIPARSAYAKVLQEELNKSGGDPRYNVINASGPGYDPASYYLFLKNEALEWNPKMVVAEIELTNDVTDAALLRWEVDPDEPETPIALRGGRYVTAWDGALLSAVVRGPYFYEKTYTYVEFSRRVLNLLYQQATVKPFPAGANGVYYTLDHERYLLDRERIESGWQKVLKAVKGIHELLRKRDVEFVLMIMPSRFVYEGDPGNPEQEFAGALVERAVAFADRNGIPYMDLTETIRAAGGTAVFLDTVHLNEQANLAVGKALYGWIRTEAGPRPAPGSP